MKRGLDKSLIYLMFLVLLFSSLVVAAPSPALAACSGCTDDDGACTWSPPTCKTCQADYNCCTGGCTGTQHLCSGGCGTCPNCDCCITGHSCHSVTCPSCNDCSPGNNCFCGGACQSYNFGYSGLDTILPIADRTIFIDNREVDPDVFIPSCGSLLPSAFASQPGVGVRRDYVQKTLAHNYLVQLQAAEQVFFSNALSIAHWVGILAALSMVSYLLFVALRRHHQI